MTITKEDLEAIEKEAKTAHDSIDDQLALKWEYVAAFKEGATRGITREREREAVLIEALEYASKGCINGFNPCECTCVRDQAIIALKKYRGHE